MYICNNKIIIYMHADVHISALHRKATLKRSVLCCGSLFTVPSETGNQFHILAANTSNRRSPCLNVCEASTDNTTEKLTSISESGCVGLVTPRDSPVPDDSSRNTHKETFCWSGPIE